MNKIRHTEIKANEKLYVKNDFSAYIKEKKNLHSTCHVTISNEYKWVHIMANLYLLRDELYKNIEKNSFKKRRKK